MTTSSLDSLAQQQCCRRFHEVLCLWLYCWAELLFANSIGTAPNAVTSGVGDLTSCMLHVSLIVIYHRLLGVWTACISTHAHVRFLPLTSITSRLVEAMSLMETSKLTHPRKPMLAEWTSKISLLLMILAQSL